MPADAQFIEAIRSGLLSDRPNEAVSAAEALRGAFPNDAEALFWSARAFMRVGRLEEAMINAMRLRSAGDAARAAELERELESAMHHERGANLLRQGRMLAAADAFREAIGLFPSRRASINNLGHILFLCGDLEAAMTEFRRAAYADPAYAPAHSNLLLSMTHSDAFSPRQVFDEHLAWARMHNPPDVAAPPIRDPRPDRPIRLGYLSPDFRQHPVAHFIYPVLSNHDSSQVQAICYADRAVEPTDAVAPMFRALPNVSVREVAGLTNDQLFALIREDQIDILVDLALHTDRNRGGMVARRAAAIQISWLAYMGTSGSHAVDYRITDAIVDPPGSSEAFAVETLVRLPRIFWCFAPLTEPPPARVAPADGPVRFGAATRLSKISNSCLDLWCDLLRACPEATMTLASDPLREPTIAAQWREKFTRRGVTGQRLQLLPSYEPKQYLSVLGSFDIALDTFPFNGGTTVCHGLYQGTPTVALMGTTSVGRVTASILSALGLAHLVAATPAQWIELNLALANSAAERAELRAALRDRFAQSLLGDAPRFTADYERLLRNIWREHCARP